MFNKINRNVFHENGKNQQQNDGQTETFDSITVKIDLTDEDSNEQFGEEEEQEDEIQSEHTQTDELNSTVIEKESHHINNVAANVDVEIPMNLSKNNWETNAQNVTVDTNTGLNTMSGKSNRNEGAVKSFKCLWCKFSTQWKNSLKKHMCTHIRTHVTAHIKTPVTTHIKTPKNWNCQFCQKNLASKSSLLNHLDKKHGVKLDKLYFNKIKIMTSGN